MPDKDENLKAIFFSTQKLRECPPPKGSKYSECCWIWHKPGRERVLANKEVHAVIRYAHNRKPVDVRRFLYQDVMGEDLGHTDCLIPDCGAKRCCRPEHMRIYQANKGHPRRSATSRPAWSSEYVWQLNFIKGLNDDNLYAKQPLKGDYCTEGETVDAGAGEKNKGENAGEKSKGESEVNKEKNPGVALPEDTPLSVSPKAKRRSGRLSSVHKNLIIDLYLRGESIQALANHFKKTRQTIYNAIPAELRRRK